MKCRFALKYNVNFDVVYFANTLLLLYSYGDPLCLLQKELPFNCRGISGKVQIHHRGGLICNGDFSEYSVNAHLGIV